MLTRMRFAHKRSLGQNFLNSPFIPRRMCEAGDVGAGDTILEIGPGTGVLTRELLATGAQVRAVEADERALTTLEETFANEIATGQLKLIHGDMRKLSAADVATACGLHDHQYKVIANIPYYLSGLLFRSFLDTPVQPRTLVFLVQKEVGERIARSRKHSLLSLSVAAFGTPSYVGTIKRGHFTPAPKVDSALIAVHDISRERLGGVSSAHFFSLLHLGFGQKRKQLRGNLAAVYGDPATATALEHCRIAPTTRAEAVPLAAWLCLATALPSEPPA